MYPFQIIVFDTTSSLSWRTW